VVVKFSAAKERCTMLSSQPPKPESLTVVMPARDEEACVGRQVAALLGIDALGDLATVRVIVVDNGSTDGTAREAALAGAQVVSEPSRGYGAACLAGVLAAPAGDIILLMDADGSDDPAATALVLAPLMRGDADLAMGSRVRGTVEPGALDPRQRAGNAVATVMLRLLYGVRVSDVGPMRAIRREALMALGMQEMTYGWSTEMLLKAGRAGYRIVEVPVGYRRRAGGRSKVSGTVRGSVGAGISMLGTILRYARWRPSSPEGVPAWLVKPADVG